MKLCDEKYFENDRCPGRTPNVEGSDVPKWEEMANLFVDKAEFWRTNHTDALTLRCIDENNVNYTTTFYANSETVGGGVTKQIEQTINNLPEKKTTNEIIEIEFPEADFVAN